MLCWGSTVVVVVVGGNVTIGRAKQATATIPLAALCKKQTRNAGLVKECPKCLKWFPFTGHSSTAGEILPELEFG